MNDNAELTSAAEGVTPNKRDAICFLLPSYKTPLMASELLHGAITVGGFEDCAFVLLLDARDPYLLAYRALVDGARKRGLNVGYFVFDGTPYCGQINRVAPIVNAETLCVIDGRHLPRAISASMAERIRAWRATSAQDMQVGTFGEHAFFPVVTQKLVERLGYMFHPLAYGRLEAENWLLTLGSRLGIVSCIDGIEVVQSPVDTVEVVGASRPADSRWVDDTLEQILEEEAERLEDYLVG